MKKLTGQTFMLFSIILLFYISCMVTPSNFCLHADLPNFIKSRQFFVIYRTTCTQFLSIDDANIH